MPRLLLLPNVCSTSVLSYVLGLMKYNSEIFTFVLDLELVYWTSVDSKVVWSGYFWFISAKVMQLWI